MVLNFLVSTVFFFLLPSSDGLSTPLSIYLSLNTLYIIHLLTRSISFPFTIYFHYITYPNSYPHSTFTHFPLLSLPLYLRILALLSIFFLPRSFHSSTLLSSYFPLHLLSFYFLSYFPSFLSCMHICFLCFFTFLLFFTIFS